MAPCPSFVIYKRTMVLMPLAVGRGRAKIRSAMRFEVAKRVAIAAATAVMTLNIWTGAPLAAMWVGSKVAGEHSLSMTGVCVVVLVLAALDYGLTMGLTWLNSIYREISGLPPATRRSIGLRSAPPGAEPPTAQRRVLALERIVVANVYVAFGALAVWYVFFAASPSSMVL
jgi:hypothetical protein